MHNKDCGDCGIGNGPTVRIVEAFCERVAMVAARGRNHPPLT